MATAVVESYDNHTLYSIQCSVDGKDVLSSSPPKISQNNFLLCRAQNNDPNAVHTFVMTINVTTSSHVRTPAFDYFLILPPPTLNLDENDVWFWADDELVLQSFETLDLGWTSLNHKELGYSTSTPGSQFTFPFTGKVFQ